MTLGLTIWSSLCVIPNLPPTPPTAQLSPAPANPIMSHRAPSARSPPHHPTSQTTLAVPTAIGISLKILCPRLRASPRASRRRRGGRGGGGGDLRAMASPLSPSDTCPHTTHRPA
eukprot:3334437-Rhodomonas_salina.1